MVKEKFTSIVNTWDTAKFVDMHPEEKYPLPLPFKYPNLNDWKEARISNIEDCIKFAANRYIRESEATVMFRGGGNQDTYSSLLKSIYEGDGRLYIEVDLNTGTVMSYYGGVYVDLDTVKMLVGLGG
jgi:hypothetical protein